MKFIKNVSGKLLGKVLLWLGEEGILKFVLNIINKIGIHSCLVEGDDLREVLDNLEPGDAILIKPFGETTNLLINDVYTHAAIKIDDVNYIADASRHGVGVRDILCLFTGVKHICVRRPMVSSELKTKIVERAKFYANNNIQYDYSFGSSKKEMYCSEFYYHCYNDVNPGVLELWERYGVKTITPTDLYKADKAFTTICEFKV